MIESFLRWPVITGCLLIFKSGVLKRWKAALHADVGLVGVRFTLEPSSRVFPWGIPDVSTSRSYLLG